MSRHARITHGSQAAAPATERSGDEALGRRRWVGLVALTLSTFIVVLDATVVLIALPSILTDLGGSLDAGTWVLAGFILTFAVLLLPFGKLGDLYGRKKLCLLGVTVFTVASVGCALAPTIEVLIAARVAQGVGAAMVEPTVLALIKTTFPRGKLGLAFGVQGVAAGVAASLGPTIGGALTTAASWHYIFLVNVPIGIIAVTGIALTLQETRNRSAPRGIDVPGALLSAAALFAIVFALIEGAQLGWGSPLILGCLAGGVLLLVIFVVVERRTAHPLVDLRLFTDRLFAVGNVLRGAVEFITLGVYFPLALFLQVVLGYSALETGVALLPLVAGSFVSSPLAGALSDRIDVRWVVIPGLLTAAAGVAWLSRLSPASTWESLLGPLSVLGLGLGSLYGTTTSATLRNVPESQSGVASGISYTAFLLGSELGLVVVAAVVQSRFTSAIEGPASAMGLPASAVEDLGASLGSPDSDATATGGLPPELVDAFSAAFTDAVSTALLVCAAVAAACAVLAIALVSKHGHPARTTDSDSI